MKLEVTREVVNDLWPLCQSGDASADSRALIDAYLAEDGVFAVELKENDMLPHAMPNIRLSPDAELRLLENAQKRARLRLLIRGGAIALIGFVILVALGGAMFAMFRGM